MTDTTEAPKPNLPQIMPTGGQVVAVVPQSVEEIFRVSRGIVQSGLAPYALTGKTDTAEAVTKAVSAVAVTIMAGAELGLPPMVALRSFTVINGRPALYGDGLINVVRRSKMAKKIEVGFMPGADDELGDDACGFCFAIRGDTGEEKRVQFSVRQAKRAGLWQTDAIVEKWNKFEKKNVRGPNDSPWFRYPERMLGWRAAGFCLRELFGDVLGGITDDWEAREISGMVDVTPPTERPVPPSPPPAPTEQTEVASATNGTEQTMTDKTPAEDLNDDDSGVSDSPKHIVGVDLDAYLTRAGEEIGDLSDEDSVIAKWEELAVEATIIDNTDEGDQREALLDKAAGIRKHRIATVTGTGDLLGDERPFPGDFPLTKAQKIAGTP